MQSGGLVPHNKLVPVSMKYYSPLLHAHASLTDGIDRESNDIFFISLYSAHWRRHKKVSAALSHAPYGADDML